jgi:hypothetical protein
LKGAIGLVIKQPCNDLGEDRRLDEPHEALYANDAWPERAGNFSDRIDGITVCVQPQAARGDSFGPASPWRADWRLQRFVSQPTLPIHLFAITDFRDDDNPGSVVNRVHDPIISLADTVLVRFPGQFFRANWSWVLGQSIDAIHDLFAIGLGPKRLEFS